MPLEVQIRGVGYNKELFARSGLDTERPPQSWEDMLEYTRILTHSLDNRSLTQRGFQFSTAASGGTSQNFFWWMRQAGITEVNLETGQSNLNHPKAIEALEHLVDLYEAGKLGSSGVSGGIGGGRIAMSSAFTPASFVNTIVANPELDGQVGVFAPRYSPETEPIAHTFSNGLAITQASRNKDEAWLFIVEMLKDEALTDIQSAMNWISGRIDLTLEMAEHSPGIDQFLDMFPYLYGSTLPPPRDISQQELAVYLKQVFDGVTSPQEALIQTHEIWTRLLNDWNQQIGN